MVKRTGVLAGSAVLIVIVWWAVSPSSTPELLHVGDPDESWYPPDGVHRSVDELMGRRVKSTDPPFHKYAWLFDGAAFPYINSQDRGFVAYFSRVDGGLDSEPVILRPRSVGDLGDVYFRITGERHPDLAGELTPYYRLSLETEARFVDSLEDG